LFTGLNHGVLLCG
jgi:hypothetical protein